MDKSTASRVRFKVISKHDQLHIATTRLLPLLAGEGGDGGALRGASCRPAPRLLRRLSPTLCSASSVPLPRANSAQGRGPLHHCASRHQFESHPSEPTSRSQYIASVGDFSIMQDAARLFSGCLRGHKARAHPSGALKSGGNK